MAKSKSKIPRILSLVKAIEPDKTPMGKYKLIYLGEIPNMPGKGVYASKNGYVYFGMDIIAFEEVDEDE